MLELMGAALLASQDAGADGADKRPEEIVVTGERIPRTLRETSSSVDVVTQREMEAQSTDRVEQLLALIPNVQLGSGSEGPAIRGQDSTGALQALPAFLGGNRPRTTVIVDGRRNSYNEFVFGAQPAWDLNRIEVFRSPQTTSQGQNSIAGAILVDSNDPTFEQEYRARAIVGNYDMREFSAMASGPISGDVAYRVAGDIRYARPTSEITDRIEGANPNHDVFGTLRAKLLFAPHGDPGARVLLTYSHNESKAPQLVGVTRPFRDRKDAGGFYGVFKIASDTLTVTATQPLGSDMTVELTLTGGRSDTRRLAFPGLGQAHIRGRDWSVDSIVRWTPHPSLRLLGGASRTHLDLRQFIDVSRVSGLGRFRDKQDSFGLFGEAEVRPIPQIALTAGLRYQQDQQNRVGTFGPVGAVIPLDFDRTFRAWLPKLSLAYDVTPELRIGALAQRAYNAGGVTLRFDTGQPDIFGTEVLWDYEVFARARLANGRIEASINAFHYDMKNAQRAKSIFIPAPGGLGAGFADLFNAPKARSSGAEAELRWRVSKALAGQMSLGLLRTRLVEAGPDYAEFSGKQFARSPHFSAALGLDWNATSDVRLSAQLRHHGSYFSDEGEARQSRVKPATIVNARVEYRTDRFILSAYARNLFDTFALIETDGRSATAEDPRMIGLSVETRF